MHVFQVPCNEMIDPLLHRRLRLVVDVFHQILSVGVTIVWSGAAAFVALMVAKVLVGLRVSEDEEDTGLDLTYHGEEAYNTEK